jgi:hypothetical protein
VKGLSCPWSKLVLALATSSSVGMSALTVTCSAATQLVLLASLVGPVLSADSGKAAKQLHSPMRAVSRAACAGWLSQPARLAGHALSEWH